MLSVYRFMGCFVNVICCLNEYLYFFIGCCMLKDVMDCGDSWYCCFKGIVCDLNCFIKRCLCRDVLWELKVLRIVFFVLMKFLNIFWKKIVKKYKL